MLSVSMIVRDEKQHIERCLASLQTLAPSLTEICVLDTGSTDGTPELARAIGARVEYLAWPGSFAEARNRALEMVRTRWVMFVDADEQVCGDAGGLREVLVRHGRDTAVFAARVAQLDEQGTQISSNYMAKVARTRLCRFVGSVHEQLILASGRTPSLQALPEHMLTFAHDGYKDPRVKEAKRQRNLGLARSDVAALTAVRDPDPDALLDARASLAQSLTDLHDQDEKRAIYEQILNAGPASVPAAWHFAMERYAQFLVNVGNLGRAVDIVEVLTQSGSPEPFRQWIVANIALRTDRYHLAFDILSNLDAVTTAVGSQTSPAQVLMARAEAATAVGDAADAIASLQCAINDYGAGDEARLPLRLLLGEPTEAARP